MSVGLWFSRSRVQISLLNSSLTSIILQHAIKSIHIPNSGSLASCHAMFDTPFPIQALRLSKIEPTHYLHGRSLEKSWYCWRGFGYCCPSHCWYPSQVGCLQAVQPTTVGTKKVLDPCKTIFFDAFKFRLNERSFQKLHRNVHQRQISYLNERKRHVRNYCPTYKLGSLI